MKIIRAVVIVFLLITSLVSCTSLTSKLNSGVKEEAIKVASAGKYRVIETTTTKQVDTGQGTSEAPCTCNQKLWLRIQPVSGSPSDRNSLCLGKDHEQLIEYAALRQGDIISFEPSEHMLDMECNGNASTFLRLKK